MMKMICSDIDGTLIGSTMQVSSNNRRAIMEYKKAGGIFTIATGRSPLGLASIYEQVRPNAPIICNNGARIYDFENRKRIYDTYISNDVIELLRYVDQTMPWCGIEIYKDADVYFCKVNEQVLRHQRDENLPDLFAAYEKVPQPWSKVLFAMEPNRVQDTKKLMLESSFGGRYNFIISADIFIEALAPDATKGHSLKRLADYLGINTKEILAVGDNENDLEMLQVAGYGVAVSSAPERVQKAADVVLDMDGNGDVIDFIIHHIL